MVIIDGVDCNLNRQISMNPYLFSYFSWVESKNPAGVKDTKANNAHERLSEKRIAQ